MKHTIQLLARTMKGVLYETLARRNAKRRRCRAPLPTDGGGGLLPGVDLNNSAALLDVMEERHLDSP